MTLPLEPLSAKIKAVYNQRAEAGIRRSMKRMGGASGRNLVELERGGLLGIIEAGDGKAPNFFRQWRLCCRSDG